MSCCGQCDGIEQQFGERTARRELRRYRKKGPIRSTRALIELLKDAGVQGQSLLDIGGGVGAIQHELLDAGAARATGVDASSAYLSAARDEAERRGHSAAFSAVHGDFVDLVDRIPDADIVTLDRVVCCYPDMDRLVAASAGKARNLYGIVYPRERVGTRMGVPLVNLMNRVRRVPFRVFLHPTRAVDAVIRREGLTPLVRRDTFLWQIWLYGRPPAGETAAG